MLKQALLGSRSIIKMIKKKSKRWEISIIKLKDDSNNRFKITRRMPEMKIAETKIFKSKKKAKEQFNEWLN